MAELQRVAQELGQTPGRILFEQETGVKEHDWRGRYWARWSEAVAEAGLSGNAFSTVRVSDEALLAALARAVRKYGRMPTSSEWDIARRADSTLPSTTLLQRRLGPKVGWSERLKTFCELHESEYGDVVAMLPDAPTELDDDASPARHPRRAEDVVGYVYLIKSGRHYKIGRSNAYGRRQRELAIQLPERARQVHVIKTDDPVGIERYWHQRFAEQRVRPDAEWFDLRPEHVAAFKRRTFQ